MVGRKRRCNFLSANYVAEGYRQNMQNGHEGIISVVNLPLVVQYRSIQRAIGLHHFCQIAGVDPCPRLFWTKVSSLMRYWTRT